MKSKKSNSLVWKKPLIIVCAIVFLVVLVMLIAKYIPNSGVGQATKGAALTCSNGASNYPTCDLCRTGVFSTKTNKCVCKVSSITNGVVSSYPGCKVTCSQGYALVNGACKPSCSDSDGTLYLNGNGEWSTFTVPSQSIKGTTKGIEFKTFEKGSFGDNSLEFKEGAYGEFVDRCSDVQPFYAVEFSCNEGLMNANRVNCLNIHNNQNEPLMCKEGACVPIPANSCVDGDLGKNIEVAEQVFVTGANGEVIANEKDFCATIPSAKGKVHEYYCNGNKLAAEEFDCPTGTTCKDGACVSSVCGNGIIESGEECDDGNNIDYDGCNNKCYKAVCIESDPSHNLTQKGQVQIYYNNKPHSAPLPDSCPVNSNLKVWKVGCNNGTKPLGEIKTIEDGALGGNGYQVLVNCPTGTYCMDGMCT